MDPLTFTLLLCEVPGMGRKSIERVLHRNLLYGISGDDFLKLNVLSLTTEYKLSQTSAECIVDISNELRCAASRCANRLHNSGVHLITSTDITYPQRLLSRLTSPPPFLFVYGNLAAINTDTFTVANSNGAPDSALAQCDEAAEYAVLAGKTVVTGHNRQAYQRPALVARRNGGRICYVLDRGLVEAFGGDLTRDLFPAARIWSPAYDSGQDVTISPFVPMEHGIAANNRLRDELIFALSDEILVGYIRTGGVMEKNCLEAVSRNQKVQLVLPEMAGDAIREAVDQSIDE